MGMDNGGPSVGALYAGAGPEGRPADTGMEMGRELYGAELAARTRYTDPLVGSPASAQPSGRHGSGAERLRLSTTTTSHHSQLSTLSRLRLRSEWPLARLSGKLLGVRQALGWRKV